MIFTSITYSSHYFRKFHITTILNFKHPAKLKLKGFDFFYIHLCSLKPVALFR